MGSILTLVDDIDLPENPIVQELTHGGFRYNHHYNWVEGNADPRHMGRELLLRTEPLDMADTEGVQPVMDAATPVGKEDYRTSKWAK